MFGKGVVYWAIGLTQIHRHPELVWDLSRCAKQVSAPLRKDDYVAYKPSKVDVGYWVGSGPAPLGADELKEDGGYDNQASPMR
jgi:hypothetical protein